jgi:hypothetical protein
MSEGEFDTSATKHQEYGVETLGRLLVGTTANSQPQLWDGAVFRIWMMTLATDARSKEAFKKVQAKNSVFYERTFGKRSKTISMVRGMNIESPLPLWLIGNDLKSGLLPLATIGLCFACCLVVVRIFPAKSETSDPGKV